MTQVNFSCLHRTDLCKTTHLPMTPSHTTDAGKTANGGPPQPIRRHRSLRPLSREHHDGLLLCWKIRRALQRDIEIDRVEKYLKHYYLNHLLPHFQAEEELLFPLIGNEHSLVVQALDDHRRLRSLFEMSPYHVPVLTLIEQKLEKHIRFEERVLFREIQEAATPAGLEKIEELHRGIAIEDQWTDRFWQ